MDADPFRQPPHGAAELSDVPARDRARHDERGRAAGGSVGTRGVHELAAPQPRKRPRYLFRLLLDCHTARVRTLREDRVSCCARQRDGAAPTRGADGWIIEAHVVWLWIRGPGILSDHGSRLGAYAGVVRRPAEASLLRVCRCRRLRGRRATAGPLLARGLGYVGRRSL